MRVSEMKEEDIHVGMRLLSCTDSAVGVVTEIIPNTHLGTLHMVKWDMDDKAYSGFYRNTSDCEVLP